MHDARRLLPGAVLLLLFAIGAAQNLVAQLVPFGLQGKHITHLAAEQGDPDGLWFPGTANLLFAATARDSVYRAHTWGRGEDWTSITPLLAPLPDITALGIQHWGYGPMDGLWLLAALRSAPGASDVPRMIRREFFAFAQASDDWIPADSGLPRGGGAPVIHAISAPYFSGHTPPQPVIAASSAGMFRGYPGGSFWEPVGDATWSVRDVAVTPHWFGRAFRAVGTRDSTGYACFSSADGGQTWSALPIALPIADSARLVAVVPGNPDTVYIGSGAALLRSTDGGATWRSTHTVSPGVITALATDPLQPAHVYAAADGAESAMLLVSRDLGMAMESIPLPGEVAAAGITCMTVALLDSIPMGRPPRRGLFIGTSGAGVWMLDLDAQPSSAQDIPLPRPSQLQCYPQPAQNAVTFAFDSHRPGEVQAAVYDLLGRCVLQRAFAAHETGRQTFTLPVTALIPGIYRLRVTLRGRSGFTPFVVRR